MKQKNKRQSDVSNAVLITGHINEEVLTDEDDDLLTVMDGKNHIASTVSTRSQRENVDRDELNTQHSVQNQPKSRKKVKPKKNNVDRLIEQYKNSVDLMIPRQPFQRVIHEIASQHGDYRFSKASVEALQESAEMYLTQLFEDAYILTLHRKSTTLNPLDMKVVQYLRGRNDPGLA